MSLEKEDMGPFFYAIITAGDFIWPYDNETKRINRTIIYGVGAFLVMFIPFVWSIL